MAENNGIILENAEQTQEIATIDIHDRAVMRSGTKAMFWALILSIVGAFVIGLALGDGASDKASSVLGVVCTVIQIICLLSMGKVSRRFTTAGILGIISIVAEVAGIFILGAVPALVISLVNLIVELVMMYSMMKGYSETLKGINDVRSRKWNSLWKWYIGIIIAEIISVVLVFVSPIIGALLVSAVAIAALVISIVLLVALGKTGNIF